MKKLGRSSFILSVFSLAVLFFGGLSSVICVKPTFAVEKSGEKTSKKAGEKARPSESKPRELVKDLEEKDFERLVLKSKRLVLLDFYATWCGPCRKLSPTIELLARQYEGKVEFFKVDVDSNPGLASRYSIEAIPAIRIFKSGQPISHLNGYVQASQVRALLDSGL